MLNSRLARHCSTSICLTRLTCHQYFLLAAIFFTSTALYSQTLEKIGVNETGDGFHFSESRTSVEMRGFNYDHDRDGRLIEDYWLD